MRGKKDANRGFYQKFHVRRMDGRDELGDEHCGCRYFVLDLNHDEHAAAALVAYANSCVEDFPILAADLEAIAARMEKKGL